LVIVFVCHCKPLTKNLEKTPLLQKVFSSKFDNALANFYGINYPQKLNEIETHDPPSPPPLLY
jgi:hypothetical protein